MCFRRRYHYKYSVHAAESFNPPLFLSQRLSQLLQTSSPSRFSSECDQRWADWHTEGLRVVWLPIGPDAGTTSTLKGRGSYGVFFHGLQVTTHPLCTSTGTPRHLEKSHSAHARSKNTTRCALRWDPSVARSNLEQLLRRVREREKSL